MEPVLEDQFSAVKCGLSMLADGLWYVLYVRELWSSDSGGLRAVVSHGNSLSRQILQFYTERLNLDWL